MASKQRFFAAVFFFLAMLVAPLVVLAQPSPGDRETARTLMKEGDDKFAAKDFVGAVKAYEGADAIMRVPTTGLALAKAQIELGKLVEARDTLLGVGRRPKEPGETPLQTKARDEAAQLATKVADRIPSVIITVEGAPAGTANVTINGEAVAPSTLGVARKVNPGAHTIAASATGFAQSSISITVKEGQELKVPIKLEAGAGNVGDVVSPPGVTQIRIVSPDKPGNVTIDGKAVGATPLTVPVSPGSHKVEIDYPGGSRDDETVDVADGKTVEVKFSASLMDEVGRHRRGVKVGFAIAPSMNISPDLGPPFYGGNASFVFHAGITPIVEIRSGLTAGFFMRGNAGAQAFEFAGVVPLALQVNLNPWFSMWAGLSAGFILLKPEAVEPTIGLSIGPEWSLLTMTGGDKRQFEVSFAQGFRFGELPFDYHQSIVFSVLFL